ncbi:MAG: undecaprenyldiphospho-muramoylpentapeptide beta-N-acetylglucosaminyltransferase [Bacteroidetes bacterium]|nr:undecaprenyldiphospho-muramoylpentapeptide beta-N-acetylglucosaminyltransferase [Bacteroidota bacterium]
MLSGGGTGGHIFPAVAIARELERVFPGCEILFIGANNRMEMEKIPQEGYRIVGLNVAGLKRSISPANLKVAWQFLGSWWKARKILKDFKPDCVIGTGGYASLAVLYAASGMGFKTLIWEGNGYAGLTNKILAKRVNTICTGFPGMEQFFPPSKTIYTGNPVREEMLHLPDRTTALSFFGLNAEQPVIFITGGSLGARTLNMAVQKAMDKIATENIQWIWQTGKNFTPAEPLPTHVKAMPFLREMNMGYAAADVVISRAGALSIAEIAVAGKPSILVPSPNVTEDHQTQNALKLTANHAALMVRDTEAMDRLIPTAIDLAGDAAKRQAIQQALKPLAKPNASTEIVLQIKKLTEK